MRGVLVKTNCYKTQGHFLKSDWMQGHLGVSAAGRSSKVKSSQVKSSQVRSDQVM